MRALVAVCMLVAAGVIASARAVAVAEDRVDAAFAKFWAARGPQGAEKTAADVVKSGVAFEDAWTRLRRGRSYTNGVARGSTRLMRRTAVGDFHYIVEVPESYDAAKRYQVRVQLHGGVMMRATGEPRGAGTIGALAGAEQIYVLPTAWRDAPWWSAAQEENLAEILDGVKRAYNVDENRVVLAGVSDGATAIYYFAMRDTTPFASFLTLNGHVMVLTNEALGIGDLYANNLLDKPLFVVNGGLDPLYPTAVVGPYVEHLKKRGVDVTYLPQPNGAHNTAWWPLVKDSFETFVRDHPRSPYPDRLTWETACPRSAGCAEGACPRSAGCAEGETVDAHNRAHWLIIDKLRAPGADPALPDVNEFSRELVMTFGVIGSGTRVSRVQAGSNADRLGLRPGDVIVSINARTVPSGGDLLDALGSYRPGDTLALVVSRGNKPVELRGLFQPQEVPAATMPMFRHTRTSGRVDLVRTGNTVAAQTRGVAAFTLLLSPDVFDFSQPVKMVANGRVAFEGRMERSVATLMKWAARDNDRTMLFGAEVTVNVK